MRVRINKKLAVKKDGIDMAVFYAKAGTIDLDETKDARIKNSHVRIKLVGKLSNEHINELSDRYRISKSEVRADRRAIGSNGVALID